MIIKIINLQVFKGLDSACSRLHHRLQDSCTVLLDFSLSVKAAPHECVIRTGQP